MAGRAAGSPSHRERNLIPFSPGSHLRRPCCRQMLSAPRATAWRRAGVLEYAPTQRGERSMSTKLRRRGWLAAGLAVLTGTALVAMAPKLGFGRTGPAQLWSDEPPKVSSQTVPAPDWVAIAKTLKPAVVNVSTKRMESGPSLPKGLDPDDPFAQFFRQFERRPHAVRSLGSGLRHQRGRLHRHQQPRGRRRQRDPRPAVRRPRASRQGRRARSRRPIWPC